MRNIVPGPITNNWDFLETVLRSGFQFSIKLICFTFGLTSTVWKTKILLFTGREVRIGKNYARGHEYGSRPQAEGRNQGRNQIRDKVRKMELWN